MIKRSKSSVYIANLSKSKETTSEFKSKRAELWSFVKQVWYVPFIWSLAWFSYWIFQENIILSNSITQGNHLNYIGFAISAMAIFVKGWISRKSNKENVEKTGEIGIAKADSTKLHETLGEMSSKESQYWESEYPTPQPKHYSLTENNQIQEQTKTHIESGKSPRFNINTSDKNSRLSQNSHQEIPSDCLLCPNLANCDQRQKRSNERGMPCPFASTPQKNSF